MCLQIYGSTFALSSSEQWGLQGHYIWGTESPCHSLYLHAGGGNLGPPDVASCGASIKIEEIVGAKGYIFLDTSRSENLTEIAH